MSIARSGRPTKDSNRDTRADLLDAAFELFARQGFRRVHLNEISDRAGVSIGLIRHYFGSKDGLIEECNKVVLDRLRAVFHQILDGSGPRKGAAFIEHLQDRTAEAFGGRFELLRYLRQLTIENPPTANEVFKEYFLLLQQELNRFEASGHLRQDANRVWLTFHLMFMQLGPVFLSEQIEAIVGVASHSSEAIRERQKEGKRILTFGILAEPETKGQ